MIGTAPCVTCGERITVDRPQCEWKRERVIWMPVGQLEPGDRLCVDKSKSPEWKVLAVAEDLHHTTVEYLRFSTKSIERGRYPHHMRFYVERVIACHNFACDLHCRELAPGRIICAECWPLQMAAIVSDGRKELRQ